MEGIGTGEFGVYRDGEEGWMRMMGWEGELMGKESPAMHQ